MFNFSGQHKIVEIMKTFLFFLLLLSTEMCPQFSFNKGDGNGDRQRLRLQKQTSFGKLLF